MRFRQDLTPAQHVSRREALAQVARGGEFGDAYDIIVREVAMPIARMFGKGSRMRTQEYEGAVNRLRAYLSSLGPPVLRERRIDVTRARPKGEEHEFLTTLRSTSTSVRGQGAYELVGVRIWLTRRRIEVSFEYNGQILTNHMLQRSIERGIASWTGRLAEIENAVIDAFGLVTVWRHAVVTGRIGSARIATPCKDGLVLGDLGWILFPSPSAILSFSGSYAKEPLRTANPVNTHPDVVSRGCRISAYMRTVVDEGLLSLAQIDLREAIARFVNDNAESLARITETALWPDARAHPDIGTVLDHTADKLAALLARPHLSDALNGKDGPIPFVSPSKGPLGATLGMPEFKALHPGAYNESRLPEMDWSQVPKEIDPLPGLLGLKHHAGPLASKPPCVQACVLSMPARNPIHVT
jgi:hypothetical protein